MDSIEQIRKLYSTETKDMKNKSFMKRLQEPKIDEWARLKSIILRNNKVYKAFDTEEQANDFMTALKVYALVEQRIVHNQTDGKFKGRNLTETICIRKGGSKVKYKDSLEEWIAR